MFFFAIKTFKLERRSSMCTIMVVDDKDLSLELIYCFLTREGYKTVKKFESPIKALKEINKGLIPDLVITDYRMPEMNGIQFLNKIAANCSRKIPSIILTGDPGSLPQCTQKLIVLEKGRMEFFKELLDTVYNICHSPKIPVSNLNPDQIKVIHDKPTSYRDVELLRPV